MNERAAHRRRIAVARIIRLHEDDGAMDRASWAGSTVEERIAAVWDLTVRALAFQGPLDASQLRLQRHLCRIERRGG